MLLSIPSQSNNYKLLLLLNNYSTIDDKNPVIAHVAAGQELTRSTQRGNGFPAIRLYVVPLVQVGPSFVVDSSEDVDVAIVVYGAVSLLLLLLLLLLKG